MPDPWPDVRVVGGSQWRTWREVRLRALQDSPQAFASTHARELSFTDQVWSDRLEDADSVCVLASSDGSPIGMGGGFPDLPGFLHVVAMWVQPSARGHRVGHRILDVIGDRAEDRGLRLHLEVNLANPGAVRCYERYGFLATGETRPLREGSTDVVERMVLAERPAQPGVRTT